MLCSGKRLREKATLTIAAIRALLPSMVQRLPQDGFYKYRTNPNPETDPWIITGAMKVNRVLSREEVDDLVRKAGREPQMVEGDEVKFAMPEPKPIGTGSFGEIYDQFKGKPKEAIAFLLKKKSGEAIGALHHKDIGDIDLVWGVEGSGHSDGFGLAKLAKFHPEVLENLQELLDDMVVTKRSANRVQLENDTHQAAIRLTWDNKKKTWLLTAFEKKNSALDNTTDTGKTSERGKRNDTATPQSTVFSESKGTDKSANIQTNADKSATASGNSGNVPSGDSKSAIHTDNFKKQFGDWDNAPENASKVVARTESLLQYIMVHNTWKCTMSERDAHALKSLLLPVTCYRKGRNADVPSLCLRYAFALPSLQVRSYRWSINGLTTDLKRTCIGGS